MHSYSKNLEDRFWDDLRDTKHLPVFVIDNFGVKYHRLRKHIETITRICTLLAIDEIDVFDLSNLYKKLDFVFSEKHFSLTKNEELSFKVQD